MSFLGALVIAAGLWLAGAPWWAVGAILGSWFVTIFAIAEHRAEELEEARMGQSAAFDTGGRVIRLEHSLEDLSVRLDAVLAAVELLDVPRYPPRDE